MKQASYQIISRIYDRVNADLEYDKWADFIEEAFRRFAPEKPQIVADIGCGTGSMTSVLAGRGYDMIGIDNSEEMLAIAYERRAESGQTNLLYLCQDMRELDLYGTVQATLCCLGGLNYLTEDGDLEKTFAKVHLFSEPGSLFLFDVDTPYKFQNVYGNNAYVYDGDAEDDTYFCTWQNAYDAEKKRCEFYLTLFEETKKGTYVRSEETQTERCFDEKEIRETLAKVGFECLGFFTDYRFTPAEKQPAATRWYIAAKAIK